MLNRAEEFWPNFSLMHLEWLSIPLDSYFLKVGLGIISPPKGTSGGGDCPSPIKSKFTHKLAKVGLFQHTPLTPRLNIRSIKFAGRDIYRWPNTVLGVFDTI